MCESAETLVSFSIAHPHTSVDDIICVHPLVFITHNQAGVKPGSRPLTPLAAPP